MQNSYFGRLQQWIHAGYRMRAQKIIVRPENHWKSVTYLTLIMSKSIVRRFRTSTNWEDASTASGPLWVTRIECAVVGEWHNVYALEFVLETDILSTYCNKNYVMWYVWLFLRDNNCQSRYCWVAIQLIIQICTLLLCWQLNLTLQISQGTASTYFRWSGQFRHSCVKGLFWDNPSNFYWNRFIFDRQGAKNKLAQFFEKRCTNSNTALQSIN